MAGADTVFWKLGGQGNCLVMNWGTFAGSALLGCYITITIKHMTDEWSNYSIHTSISFAYLWDILITCPDHILAQYRLTVYSPLKYIPCTDLHLRLSIS